MKARIARAFGAHSFGMALSIVIQLASLPLFLSHWSVEQYGTWLLLSAIPAYLSMTDVGMVAVAGNRMMMLVGRHDWPGANRVFHSAQLFVLGTVVVVVVAGLAGLAAFPPGAAYGAHASAVVAALAAAVLVSIAGGLAEQVFRADGRPATAALAGNLCRLADWLGGLAGLFLAGTFIGVALGSLLGRTASVLATAWFSRRVAGLSWGVAGADRQELRLLLAPALAMMAFPLVGALSLQSLTLLVGVMLGPVVVALFNSYRTIARTALQANATLTYAVWPEFSRLAGAGDEAALRQLYRRTALVTLAASLALSLLLYALAPWILQVWSRGKIPFDAVTMAGMLLYAAVAGAWHAPRVLLMATNRHTVLAPLAVALALLLLALGWLAVPPWGLAGVVAAMVTVELLNAGVAYHLAARALRSPGLAP